MKREKNVYTCNVMQSEFDSTFCHSSPVLCAQNILTFANLKFFIWATKKLLPSSHCFKLKYPETEGMTIQRLPQLGIHPIYNNQTQTLLHMPESFCLQDPDIALSCEAMPMPGKYRSGCSQSSIGWNTGPPMEELEKVPKELKGSATL